MLRQSAADLIRLGELMKLTANAVKTFGEGMPDASASKIADAAKRVADAADEIIEAGRKAERGVKP